MFSMGFPDAELHPYGLPITLVKEHAAQKLDLLHNFEFPVSRV